MGILGHQSKDEAKDRAFSHGSSGSAADSAVEGKAKLEDRHVETPHARPAEPLSSTEKPDQLADKAAACEDRQEALVDESIEESFPASDPPSAKRIT